MRIRVSFCAVAAASAVCICLFSAAPAKATLMGFWDSDSTGDNAETVTEYSPTGTELDQVLVPTPSGGYGQLHDLVVDQTGNLQVIYGAGTGPELATYNGSSWTFHSALNWSLEGVTNMGKIATYGNYIYCQSQQDGSANGIIRFDESKNYAAQLFTIPNGTGEWTIQDVSMGMDGHLYAVGYSSYPGNVVLQLDPNTMAVTKEIQLTGNSKANNVVVDAQGNIYTFGNGYLTKLSPVGTLLDSIVENGTNIAISNDGNLVTTQGAKLATFDDNLDLENFFPVQGAYWGDPFVAMNTYQSPVPEPTSLAIALPASALLLVRRRRSCAA